MFRGSSTISLDGKGRIAIPTRYRAKLEACCERQLIVTLAINHKGTHEQGCLWLYPLPEWEMVEKNIDALPTLHQVAQKIRRLLIGYATECELDAQGRLLLPEMLRQMAALDKQVILMGQLKKFEIWNEAMWNAKLSSDEGEQGGEISGMLESLSF